MAPRESAVVVEETADILEQEASIAALAHAVVLQLAAVAEALHRIDVEMEHLRDFGGGEHLPKLVQCHRAHPVVPFVRWTFLCLAESTPRDDASAGIRRRSDGTDGSIGFQAVLESGSGQYPPAGVGAAQQRPGGVSSVRSREDE